MSKIEVDAIDKQSGSTLTLGGSGTAVTLACGATQTGFGRTGTVDWNTTPKTATFSAVSGDGFFCNTTAGSFTCNLPAGSSGAIVSLADYAGTWQTNKLIVSPNGTDKIGSINTNVNLETEGQSVTFIFVDSTQGWINTMDSTSNVRGSAFICASVSGSGNTLVTAPDCANAKIATFTGPGTFTVNSAASVAANNEVSYVIVAGGAAGGSPEGGGGGAGGYREVKSPVTPYTASPLDGYPSAPNRVTVTATAFPIVVGAGGATVGPSPSSNGNPGSISSFGGIISAGGGGGGSNASPGNGLSGGSGGGSRRDANQPCAAAGNTPPVSPPQGNNGGSTPGCNWHGSGGGGGATAVGVNGTGNGSPSGENAGNGGAGATTSITASPVAYAGGGGGSINGSSGNIGTGGTGGGGNGSQPPACATAGTTNRGGGGGGASGKASAAGGSGIVIIRYKYQ
jgi:hypothetical protein